MSQRVAVCGKVKTLTVGAKAKASLNRAKFKSHTVDPKRDELHMTRTKRP